MFRFILFLGFLSFSLSLNAQSYYSAEPVINPQGNQLSAGSVSLDTEEVRYCRQIADFFSPRVDGYKLKDKSASKDAFCYQNGYDSGRVLKSDRTKKAVMAWKNRRWQKESSGASPFVERLRCQDRDFVPCGH